MGRIDLRREVGNIRSLRVRIVLNVLHLWGDDRFCRLSYLFGAVQGGGWKMMLVRVIWLCPIPH
jgi:hypothetical protein